MPAPRLKGKLRIGDQWNAITLLAQTQTNPLKAVAELVENSLDAKATNVEILRARRGGRHILKVVDDGEGIRLDQDGRPDFLHVATHICDSMKRHLHQRKGIHGEFGIGLLGFWSLGEELKLASSSSDGQVWEMVMKKGNPSYRIQPVRGRMATPGTELTIIGLLPSTRRVLGGERLQHYLATELRDRIRQLEVRVRITDRIGRKALIVRPTEFQGVLLRDFRSVRLDGIGQATLELYYRVPAEAEVLSVALFRDGTRVLPDVRQLSGLDREPWTLNRLEGLVDCPALSVAPGTRQGVVPNETSTALVTALAGLEESLVKMIRKREEAEAEKASETLFRDVQNAVLAALRQIDDDAYSLFEVGGRGGSEGKREIQTDQEPLELSAGPLETARIIPAIVRVPVESRRTAFVRARDAEGRQVFTGLAFAWGVEGASARIEVKDSRAVVHGEREGEARLFVTVSQGEKKVSCEAQVLIVPKGLETGEGQGKNEGLPRYNLVSAAGEPWRSRYVSEGLIHINSGHRDYLAARATLRKLRRYIGKLYAKEVILLNNPELNTASALERLVELLTRMEEKL